jgi:hypothetical protein
MALDTDIATLHDDCNSDITTRTGYHAITPAIHGVLLERLCDLLLRMDIDGVLSLGAIATGKTLSFKDNSGNLIAQIDITGGITSQSVGGKYVKLHASDIANQNGLYLFTGSKLVKILNDNITDDRAHQLPDASGTYVLDSAVQTLTRKRYVPRYGTSTTTASLTVSTDLYDIWELTAQATNLTIATTGTPNVGERFELSVTSTGSVAFTWDPIFVAGSFSALPTGITGADRIDMLFMWISTNKWKFIGFA